MLFLTACTFSKKINTEEKKAIANAELILAKEKVPGITMEQLTLGRKTYTRDCSSCHALKNPAKFTLFQWEPILKRMFVKAKVVDSTERKLIADYVIAKSK